MLLKKIGLASGTLLLALLLKAQEKYVSKVGLFCTRTTQINDSGWADVDWFKVEAVK